VTLPARFPRRTLDRSREIYRIHRADHGPWWFSSDGSGRFDPVGTATGACYLAERRLGAWVEVFREQMLLAEAEVHGRALKVLARHQVQCVVIGAYAAVLSGVEVATRDIDITPATDQANLERLVAALAELHAALRVPNESPIPLPADARLLARTEILNLTTDAGELDISRRPNGTDGYDDLKTRRALPGARPRASDRDRLARSRQRSGHPARRRCLARGDFVSGSARSARSAVCQRSRRGAWPSS
jgi:hypothetical protein